MRDKRIFFDFTPTSYGDFFTGVVQGIIAESLTMRAERLQADEPNRRRYSDLAQQILKSGFVHKFAATDKQLYDNLVERVLKSGVKFAAGSDMAWFYPGKTRGEASTEVFVNLRRAGMPA